MTSAGEKKAWEMLKYQERPFRADSLLVSSSAAQFSPDIFRSISILSAMVMM
jgi:hypothetical protein